MADNGLNIDELQIQITATTNKAVDAINKLAENLRSLSKIQLDATNIKQFVREISTLGRSKGLEKVAKNLTEIAKATSKLQTPNELASRMQNTMKQFGSAEDSLFEVGRGKGAALPKTFATFTEQLKDLNDVGKNLTGLNNIADGLGRIVEKGAGLKEIGQGAVLVARAVRNSTSSASKSASGLQDTVNDLTTSISPATTAADRLVISLKTLFTNITNGAKKLPNAIGNVFNSMSGLLRMVKRVALMRLIRAAIRGITTSIKEGTQALIDWDRAYGNNTSYAAKTADEIAAKWGEVKKSFGAAAMPLIQAVQPALMSVMNAVISVVNGINMAFRSLQGYSTYMKATTQKIGEGLDTATGKAKELQRVLFGFDELNVLPSLNNGGSGASNSSASAIDFVETAIDSAKASTFKSILEMVKAIGKAIVGWKISKAFLSGLGAAGDKLTGFSLAIAGLVISATELKDQLDGGVNWVNLTGLVAGLTTVVIGLGKAFGGVGTAIGLVVSGVTLAIAPLKELTSTGKLTTASATQLGLSIAATGASIAKFSNSLIPLVAGGVLGGLVAGIAALKSSWFELKESIQIEMYGSTISEFTQTIKDNAKAIKDRRTEILNNKSTQQAELEYVDGLVKKYNELTKKENLTSSEKEQIAAITKEIIKIYPELNDYIDKQTGKLNLSTDAWKKIYDEKLKNIQLEAKREKLIELYKTQYDAELKLAQGQEKVNQAYKVWQDALIEQKRISDLTSKLVTLREKLIASGGATDNLTKSEKDLLMQYTNGTGKVSDLESAIGGLNKKYEEANLKTQTANGVYKETVEGQKAVRLEYEETGKAITRISKGVQDAVKQYQPPRIRLGIELNTSNLAKDASNVYSKVATAFANNAAVIPVVTSTASGVDHIVTSRTSAIAATRFAAGGTPDIGTLFYAGEAGAEVVANMGHETGVMNVKQMQEAVASGNVDVVNAIYAMANTLAREIRDKDTNAYISQDAIGRAATNYQFNQSRRGVAY